MVCEIEVDVKYCLLKVLDNEDGCYYVLRIVIDGDIRWLLKECCIVVRIFFDGCYLFVFFGKVYFFDFFIIICDKKFFIEK